MKKQDRKRAEKLAKIAKKARKDARKLGFGELYEQTWGFAENAVKGIERDLKRIHHKESEKLAEMLEWSRDAVIAQLQFSIALKVAKRQEEAWPKDENHYLLTIAQREDAPIYASFYMTFKGEDVTLARKLGVRTDEPGLDAAFQEHRRTDTELSYGAYHKETPEDVEEHMERARLFLQEGKGGSVH